VALYVFGLGPANPSIPDGQINAAPWPRLRGLLRSATCSVRARRRFCSPPLLWTWRQVSSRSTSRRRNRLQVPLA